MVEQGLVLLIQAGLGSPPLAPGGWFDQLPLAFQITAATPMAWTYKSIVSDPSFNLGGQSSWTEWEVQIDSYGYTAAQAVQLARAIDNILRGPYQGTLPDPDATVVHGIWRRHPFIDGFNDGARSFVRSMEYLIQYLQI